MLVIWSQSLEEATHYSLMCWINISQPHCSPLLFTLLWMQHFLIVRPRQQICFAVHANHKTKGCCGCTKRWGLTMVCIEGCLNTWLTGCLVVTMSIILFWRKMVWYQSVKFKESISGNVNIDRKQINVAVILNPLLIVTAKYVSCMLKH